MLTSTHNIVITLKGGEQMTLPINHPNMPSAIDCAKFLVEQRRSYGEEVISVAIDVI